MRVRVVWGFEDTIAIFVPNNLLSIEDLPTLALPTIAINAVFGVFIIYPFFFGNPLNIKIVKIITEIANKAIATGFARKYANNFSNAFG